jgi:hypothetical protein
VVAAVASCTGNQDRLFRRLDSGQTGVDFVNTITTNDSLLNPLAFFYIYNGGGVGVGDVNGDGRPDLYFAGNMVGNRLYLNQGKFRFRDVTEAAGVKADDAWSTGIVLADVNDDDLTDIYVCVGGPSEIAGERRNRLYVNQGVDTDGVPAFEEQAEAYGLADEGHSTHAAFFDYDRDGDLDLYVLNTSTLSGGGSARDLNQGGRDIGSGDRLYRNDGNKTFTDVSERAGIRDQGYGLGLAISDVNRDGWLDVYAANDFMTTDLLYVNNRDGTFTNRSPQYLKHQSYSAMGVDIADINNDTLNDIMVLDMLPQDPQRRRVISNSGGRHNGEWQYGRNTLQLNNGLTPEGGLAFSEIGQLADVEATGWSWAPLLADYDNDGDRDLFITNGYGELVTQLDFIRRREQLRRAGQTEANREALFDAMDQLPEVRLDNRFFENMGVSGSDFEQDLHFENRTGTWASSRAGISNGAAFADLDQDGDLDLVTNNINEEATILENQAGAQEGSNALRVKLHGPTGNRAGLGVKVIVANQGMTQYHDHSLYRGYQSTVESVIHFGLGADSTADSLRVVWPDGTANVYTDVPTGRVLNVHHDTTTRIGPNQSAAVALDATTSQRSYLFQEVARRRGLDHQHVESRVVDFRESPLLPHSYSQNGPGIAVGDVNGDGLDDVFIGADQGTSRLLYMQTQPGYFQADTLSVETAYEDMGALFFDADQDGDQDLYVVSGGRVRSRNAAAYQDRLYLNDGQGNLSRDPEALPAIVASGSVVTASDYDEDGDLDLFVGGRWQPGQYPLPPRSYLLQNDSEEGQVRFTDVTQEVATKLSEIGLVTDARWTDFTGDGQVDLVVVGEWMPISFFSNEGGQFVEMTEDVGLDNTAGWWNSLSAGDFDRDGDVDYVAGNLGLNTRYEAASNEPVRVHAKDFDEDGRMDPVISHYIQGTHYPAHGRDEMIEQILAMMRRFRTYREYAEASFEEVFTEAELEGTYVAKAVRFETSYIENQGDGTFEIRALPIRTQFAPVFGIQSGDYNGDGHLDILMVGNWYAPDSETGRADAFVGEFLRGDGTGHFTSVGYTRSGFFVDGDAKGLVDVAIGENSSLTLVTQNDGPLKAFRSTRSDGHFVLLRPLDRYALLTYDDGSVRKEEFFHGSTYLSQSSRVLWIPPDVSEVVISGADGNRRTVAPGKVVSSRLSN